MTFPINFVSEDAMTELSNANNKATLLQRTTGFGSTAPTMTKATNGTGVGTNTGGNIFGNQPLIASVGVAIGGSVVNLDLLKGGSDMPKPAQGSFTVQGDIIVNASILNGMELIHRNITQDKNPTYEYAGTGSFPAAHTVVASASLNDTKGNHTVVAIPNTIKYEVDPTVTLSATPALATGALEGVVTITGTDRNDVAITRVARWNASNIGTLAAQQVGGFFKTITTVSSEGFSAGNLVVTVEDKATKITFNPDDTAIRDYLDLELDLGGTVPFGFFSGVVNGVAFQFSRDEVVQYTLSCLFGKTNIRQNLNGGASVSVIPATVKKAEPEVFVGTQCEVELDGTVIPLDTAGLQLSQSYTPGPYIGRTIWPKKPRRSGYRTLGLNLTFPATEQNNWFEFFQAHADFENLIVRASSGAEGTNGQFGGKIEWHFDNLTLSESPSISTAGVDVAGQTAALMPFSETSNAAFRIVTIQNDYPEKLYHYA